LSYKCSSNKHVLFNVQWLTELLILKDFKLAIFSYAGHGSGTQFLKSDDIQKLNVRAVTFLFGCSSVTSKDLGGRVERAGIWHFYLMASWWVFIVMIRERRKNTILGLLLTCCCVVCYWHAVVLFERNMDKIACNETNLMHYLSSVYSDTIPLHQRFPSCGPRTTGGPRVLPLWSS
jgi:hypothetical protein